jgi:hypothetical protein
LDTKRGKTRTEKLLDGGMWGVQNSNSTLFWDFTVQVFYATNTSTRDHPSILNQDLIIFQWLTTGRCGMLRIALSTGAARLLSDIALTGALSSNKNLTNTPTLAQVYIGLSLALLRDSLDRLSAIPFC